jgi:hypothetical protein
MSQNKEQILIDHLDRSLQGGETVAIGDLIGDDAEMAATWFNLQLSVDIIKEAGLYEQVLVVRKQFEQNRSGMERPLGVVRPLNFRYAMRVAACILLIAGAAVLYKYTTTNPEGLYNKYFVSYDLNTSRDMGQVDGMEQAYRQKNWQEVITRSNQLKEKDNKSLFLSGMAEMELNKFKPAILLFQLVLARNKQSGDAYFQDEAEYYIAMCYLANNQAGAGIAILEKIRGDKDHLFYKKANEMSSLDFKILKYKLLH